MADYELRKRKGEADEVIVKPIEIGEKKKKSGVDDQEETNWTLDVLRVISFGLIASVVLSHFVSGGDSMWWNLKNKPNYFRVDWWKAQLVSLDHGATRVDDVFLQEADRVNRTAQST